MAESAPTPQALRRAKLFWEQAALDSQGARQKHKAHAYVESGYLSFQAALNALTAVCYLNAKFQLPNHSAVQMAGLCAAVDPGFDAIREACTALEAVQHHSPFEAEPDTTGLAQLSAAGLKHSAQVIEAARAYLKAHRKRFFAP
jgi:hypothetical protein